MDFEEQLRQIGLTSYEAKAYLAILDAGIIDAKQICKQTQIPYGKIYETLSLLENKKLIESQNTRPKKFHALKPTKAFDTFYAQKKQTVEDELDKTRSLLDSLSESLAFKKTTDSKESQFWRVAFAKDIPKLVLSCFEESEKEVNILKNEPGNSEKVLSHEDLELIFEKTKQSIQRGVTVRFLRSSKSDEHFQEVVQKMDCVDEFNKNSRIIDQELPGMFMIFDSETVLMQVLNPLKPQEVLAMIKVWNPTLAKDLNDKFLRLWKQAK